MDCSGHPSLTFRHWAGVSTYTSDFSLAGTCVFVKQLLGPLHCGYIAVALLLANLRSNFAEFLNNSSLAHLRILSLTTCVRSRYGPHIIMLATFLESWHQSLRYLIARSLHFTPCILCTDLPLHLLSRLYYHPVGSRSSLLCHYFTYIRVQEYQPVVHRLRFSASP